jgi:tartrate dehydratase beta subunit/fumarate hydratase class I family protein
MSENFVPSEEILKLHVGQRILVNGQIYEPRLVGLRYIQGMNVVTRQHRDIDIEKEYIRILTKEQLEIISDQLPWFLRDIEV